MQQTQSFHWERFQRNLPFHTNFQSGFFKIFNSKTVHFKTEMKDSVYLGNN